MIGGPIPPTVDIPRELKDSGVPCYGLTDMEAETYPLRRVRFDFLRWFDGTVVSPFEGIAKPDLEIFQRLLDQYGLTAATWMIDDSPRNLVPARSLGMSTIHFESAERLQAAQLLRV